VFIYMHLIITKFQQIFHKQHSVFKTKVTEIFPYTFYIFDKTKATTLGRWQSHECTNKTFSKVDYSNVDHCGPCGLNHLNKDVKQTTPSEQMKM